MANPILPLLLSLAVASQPFHIRSSTVCDGAPSYECQDALADAYDRLGNECLDALRSSVPDPDQTIDFLTPVPEPSALPVWAVAGLVGLVATLVSFSVGFALGGR